MTAEKIKSRIVECPEILEFAYNGKDGNVDHYYIPETKSYEFDLFFDGETVTVYDIEDVMNTPFIDGHTLSELAEKIEFTNF